MFDKLTQLISTYPRIALVLIASILILGLMLFIALLKGVALILLCLVAVGLVYLIRKPFKKHK